MASLKAVGIRGEIMKRIGYLLIASAILAALPAHANISAFKHIVVIVQENRTPDNLFWELCQAAACSTSNNQRYDIQTTGWKNGQTTVDPVPVDLQIAWDIEHNHKPDWINMCHQQGTSCLMDGAANEVCYKVPCRQPPPPPEFTYVQRHNGTLDVLGPYITLALTYGWANKMFETNQGPSFPAHQFIYGGNSAPLVDDVMAHSKGLTGHSPWAPSCSCRPRRWHAAGRAA
jgi:phospholipase C